MKIKNKIIMALTVLLSASGLVNGNVASVSAADAAPVNSNGISEVVADETFVRDFDRQMGTDPDDPATGYVEQSLIGVAQYFGVFANDVNFEAGTANTNFELKNFRELKYLVLMQRWLIKVAQFLFFKIFTICRVSEIS